MTAAQRRVLTALVTVTRDGWPATDAEVAKAAGLASKSGAHEHLHALKRGGLAKQHPRNPLGGWLPTHR